MLEKLLFYLHGFQRYEFYNVTRCPTRPRTGKTSPYLPFLRIAACMFLYMCMYVCVYVCLYECLYVCICACMCVCVCVWLLYVCLYVYQMCFCSVCLDAHPSYNGKDQAVPAIFAYSSMYVYMLVCACMCAYVCLYLRVCVCLYVCLYVFVCACMCVCMCKYGCCMCACVSALLSAYM